MIQTKKISESELQAFVDGQLDPKRHAFIAEYINTHPEVAQRIAAYRQQNDLLHDLFDDTLDESVPKALTKQPDTKIKTPAFQLAASITLLIIGGVLGWMLHSQTTPQFQIVTHQIVNQAVNAHVVYTPEVKHPVEVGAQQEAHLVKWLSKRLNEDIKSPNLSSLGYQLVGGRLLPGDTGPAAFFMYENASGERLTLFVRTQVEQNNETAFRFHNQNGLNVFYWIDGPVGYALTGSIDKSTLLNVAHSVYQQINL